MSHFLKGKKDYKAVFAYPGVAGLALTEVFRVDAGKWIVSKDAMVSVAVGQVEPTPLPKSLHKMRKNYKVVVGDFEYSIPGDLVRRVVGGTRSYLVMDVASNYLVRVGDQMQLVVACFGFDEDEGTRALFSVKPELVGGDQGRFEVMRAIQEEPPEARTHPAYAPKVKPPEPKPTEDELEQARRLTIENERMRGEEDETEDLDEFDAEVRAEAQDLVRRRGLPLPALPKPPKLISKLVGGEWTMVEKQKTSQEMLIDTLQASREEQAREMAAVRKRMGEEVNGVFVFKEITAVATGEIIEYAPTGPYDVRGAFELPKPPPQPVGVPENYKEIFAKRSTKEELKQERLDLMAHLKKEEMGEEKNERFE